MHHIACKREDDSIKGNFLKDIKSNILILNKDENKKARLLYSNNTEVNESKTKICYLTNNSNVYSCENPDNFYAYVKDVDNEENQGTNKAFEYLSKDLSLEGGLAYIDVSGNCVPDIILSHDDDNGYRTIEIYVSDRDNDNNYRFSEKNVIKISEYEKYGAFAITRINDETSKDKLPLFDMIIPNYEENKIYYLKNQVKLSYTWSKYYCQKTSENNMQDNIFGNFSIENYISLSIDGNENIQLDHNFSTVMRFGDFRASSNPGFIVKLYTDGVSKISLFERENKKFTYFDGIKMEDLTKDNDDFRMGIFFDIDEKGSYSFILPTKKGKNYFFLNYQKDCYLLKEKLVNDKNYFYDANLGTSFRYIINEKNGDRHMDITSQLAQTSDTNIPLPFGLNGMNGTNNYAEYFEFISGNYYSDSTTKFKSSDEKNYLGQDSVLPNTQSMAYKYYNKKDKIEWNLELMLSPMYKMWLFFIIIIVVIIIVLGFIIFLHVRELKEEQKETTKFKSWFA